MGNSDMMNEWFDERPVVMIRKKANIQNGKVKETPTFHWENFIKICIHYTNSILRISKISNTNGFTQQIL